MLALSDPGGPDQSHDQPSIMQPHGAKVQKGCGTLKYWKVTQFLMYLLLSLFAMNVLHILHTIITGLPPLCANPLYASCLMDVLLYCRVVTFTV
jgi:hypothetical protein